MGEVIKEDIDDKPKPPDVDRGYAWVVLAGCFFMYMFVVGSIKAYGVLYTEMVEYFGTGSGNTAWIGSVCSLLMLGLGPIANLLSRKFSFRKVSFIGGVLLGLGFFLSGFVPRMEYMYITFGVVAGIGYGLTFSPCSTIISFYFDKHRALANGITVSASGIGALSFPFLYKYLIEEFTLTRALWVVGAIVANVCVAACVFRQPHMLVQEKRRERAAYKRKSDQKALLNGNSAFGYDEDAKEETKKKSCDCSGLNLNFSLFKNPLFTMYAFAFTFCMNGYGNNIILIPSHVKELGYNKTYVALSVTILGGCEVIARIFFGWFADLELIKRKNIFLISMFVSAIFAFIAPYFDSFIFMAIYAAIVGIFPGSFWSLISVLVIDVVGLENFTSAFGLISLCLALGASVSQPIIGWLRDIYGNWYPSFIVTGCLFTLAGLTVCLQPFIKRCCMRPETDQLYLDMLGNVPLRHAPKTLPPEVDDNDSLLEEDVDITFTSHRISQIYRPYKPESPQSPHNTSAPIVDPSEV
ncbi:monocarboxylate transporter 12-like [Ruditapes philippinarum]|uniref:monocarboxylate transporter 12-like n=1 Tax=Ruditapes philippinarum TaxID=129788 RepID=UPI00295A8BFE|nr:monocarboxylate transporter 12-like [Ruditapes philippinarum]XP_060593173.1 monocarboxylate transporter 12-like [Ruditapes philippinarum]XP_060593174.1 monocarboxylate transporter 12-like [Ruditapes philippinarum]XP_060593175.1 monocarboxylate transporter 12-like [Ruditapes philippinarum]XP_060593176.1 monocarboxylate transporter 12-like [Ruditapes philippinarum]XP_060593177.1 monocarboxylate transporter 12-like [Ruditapes philippinarum]XP_060593178.1 monocarboxylate transporter 12-like [R